MENNVRYLDQHEIKTVPPQPLIDSLDLVNLPGRLDDETLSRVQAIADAPLPPLNPVGERHLKQCLRVMMAVLPKRATDEVTGELFVAAYVKKLGGYCDAQISYLADKAMERCKWFPTIAECMEIILEWRRYDDATRRKYDATSIARREERTRDDESRRFNRWDAPELTQEDVDTMSPELIRVGLRCGALVEGDNGKFMPAPPTVSKPWDER